MNTVTHTHACALESHVTHMNGVVIVRREEVSGVVSSPGIQDKDIMYMHTSRFTGP